jgi:FAD/FMN-containing dehydrogenase
VIAVNAEDFDCVVQPGVRREELNLHLRDTGTVFPDRPRRQCHDRRHGVDPRIGHQRRALWHDARSGAEPEIVTPQGNCDPHGAPRAQVGGGL